MHARESADALSVIKYAAMMALCSKQAWAVYLIPQQRLLAKPYTGARTHLMEVCHP
ncbi:hypothetical protein [Pseudomonas sp. MH10out]|uniref:hypothetical protein n=1 Tax=Pseudomonas sp. MH10out TaxID=3048628 RepID=UPI002B2386AF|nr:hypothetical protein [Pseudomonas sp. MH10out]MEB0078060.1 hypothetical protein [Pseudomonas sp. MH10out]